MTITLDKAELLKAFQEQRRQDTIRSFHLDHVAQQLEDLIGELHNAISTGVFALEAHLTDRGICTHEDLEALIGEGKTAMWYEEFKASRQN